MAHTTVKISQLPTASFSDITSLTDVLPIIDGDTTKQITVDNLFGAATHITSSGVISSSKVDSEFSLYAHSASFSYISASHLDLDEASLSIGGTSFTKTDVDNLKAGKSIATDTDKKFVNSADSTTYIRMGSSGKAWHYINDQPVFKMGVGLINLGDTSTKVEVGTAGIGGGNGGVRALILTGSGGVTIEGGALTLGTQGITGGMIVTGSTVMSGSATVSGSFTVTDLLNVLGNYGQTGSFSISGSTTLAGDVNADGQVTVTDLLTVLGGFGASGSCEVSGGLDISGSFDTSGSFNSNGSSSFSGSVEFTGSIENTGSFDTSGSFNSDGSSSFSGSVEISGSTTIDTAGGGFVVNDLLNLLANYGSVGLPTGSGAGNVSSGDINLDGQVNVNDLLLILGGMGNPNIINQNLTIPNNVNHQLIGPEITVSQSIVVTVGTDAFLTIT
tara:strand:- start:1428 stop:2762 length:1335 start_codon:yes stop_codon:yes gene_type:complete